MLLGLLKHRTHKDLAIKIIQTVLDAGTRICNVERVTMLLRFIQPLVQDPEEGGGAADDLTHDVGGWVGEQRRGGVWSI